jgi:hypothetical protein
MMEKVIEVEIAFDEKRVKLTGPESFVRGELGRLTAIARGEAARPIDSRGQIGGGVDDRGLAGAADERQFVALKKPEGHQETAAVLAFWLMAHGVAEFTQQDIRRSYIRAEVRPPKVVSQALRDAKRDRDFIEAGSQRGSYKLTAHGDRFVRFDLPRQTAERRNG